MKKQLHYIIGIAMSLISLSATAAPLVYEGTEGIGKGKHIVFIANDHEYRSEESCPLLAKLLAKHQGFKCTVLFGIDKEGNIKPGAQSVPNLEVLKEADLLVFFTRFMSLPDQQVQHITDYLERGAPIIGLRTSTHSFNDQGGNYAKFNFKYKGEDYSGGFGNQIFGNTWDKEKGQSHYGQNHREGGTYTPVASAKSNIIMTGVTAFHAYSGSYKSHPPLDATPLLEVQVLNTFESSANINTKKEKVNVGWARNHYTAPSGTKKDTRVVYTSIGASEDFLDPTARRFLINACLWAVGMEKSITADLNVDLVGGFEPSAYSTGALHRLNVKPSDLAGFDSNIMPKDAKFAGISATPNKRINRPLQIRPKLLERVRALHPEATLPAPPTKKHP